MEISLYGNTHGISYRDDVNMYLAHTPPEQMQPVKIAQRIEQAGFHSMWFPDHVSMPAASESFHTANQSGKRAYQQRHNMLDAAVTMGAVAVHTKRIKLAPSCLIAPYRHPLSDARQFATVDILSNGRMWLGVAAGWMEEEFASVGIPYAERNKRMEECIQLYRRCWTDDLVSFDGAFYPCRDLSMDPKPVQKPHPPILLGANFPRGARRAARYCNGIYPLFLDSHVEQDRFTPLQDIILEELEAQGKSASDFLMVCASGARITDGDAPEAKAVPRKVCTGTADQILGDLEGFAKAGYSMVVCMFDCPSGTLAELEAQIDRFGEEIVPEAKKMTPAGPWKPAD